MRIKLNYIAPLLAAGAAAVAISAAPIAAAASAPAPHGACDTGVVSGSICGTPGDVGINASPPPVSFDPYGGEGLLLGASAGLSRWLPRRRLRRWWLSRRRGRTRPVAVSGRPVGPATPNNQPNTTRRCTPTIFEVHNHD